MPEAHVLIYDQKGAEILPRQSVPPRPGVIRDFACADPVVGPSLWHALSGVVTCPVEAATLFGTTALLESEARRHGGTEAPIPLQFSEYSSQLFLPRPGLLWGFVGLMLLGSAASALICFVIPGRYAFSKSRTLGWALIGLLCGPVGLLLMVTLLDWPGQVACPKCRKLRVVTREHCEHCQAEHALPEMDGTEIFEPAKFTLEAVLTTSGGGHL
jgi:hypothetical protein